MAMSDYDLRPSIKKFFQKAHPGEVASAKLNRDVARWLLDLVRNVAVLGALKYFEARTGSIYISVIYWAASGALWFYLFSYWQEWELRLFAFMPYKTAGELLDFILNLVIGIFMMFYLNSVLATIAAEIAQAQLK
jgi:hypothetical protein